MTDFVPSEKGVTIRQPSTSNLMLDSADRNTDVYPSPNSFTINRPNSILNGFFTRIGTTEVVLEWLTPNIGGLFNNESMTVDLSGGGATTGTDTSGIVVPTGFYTQAQLIDYVVMKLNDLSGSFTPNVTWSVNSTTIGVPALVPSANVYVQFSGPLAELLGWNTSVPVEYGPTAGTPPVEGFQIPTADLRPYRYLDFVSVNLTYNQDLKDATTSLVVRDVLCRWYMAFDQPPSYDAYGFPILMGYSPFVLRRTFSPPKQIKWAANQPIGQLSFQVFGNDNALASFNFQSNWLMTLQVSEV